MNEEKMRRNVRYVHTRCIDWQEGSEKIGKKKEIEVTLLVTHSLIRFSRHNSV